MIQTMHVQLADTGVLGQLDKILWVVLGLLHALEVPVSVSCVLLGQRLEVKAAADAGLRQYNPVVHGVERGGNSGGASLLLLGVSARLLGLVQAGRLMKEFSVSTLTSLPRSGYALLKPPLSGFSSVRPMPVAPVLSVRVAGEGGWGEAGTYYRNWIFIIYSNFKSQINHITHGQNHW